MLLKLDKIICALSARRQRRAVVLIISALLLSTSCSAPTEKPGEFKTVSADGWEYGDVLVFNEKGDTINGSINAVELYVRHTDDYPYANLWIELAYTSSDSTYADTFNIRLANEYGKWLGSGSGPVMQHTTTLHPRVIPDSNTTFRLRHIMRVDQLTDIEQIGLTYVTVHDDK